MITLTATYTGEELLLWLVILAFMGLILKTYQIFWQKKKKKNI